MYGPKYNYIKMKAYFAGGCFWCLVPFIKNADGVLNVTVGYSGRDEINPRYEDVKAQKTGHRETVMIEYDEKLISYEDLLKAYLNTVDPFDGEGQFIDRGHSYTCAVYYLNEEEKNTAEEEIRKLEESSGQKVYIAVEKFKSFYRAEECHQDFYLKHPEEFKEELINSGRIK